MWLYLGKKTFSITINITLAYNKRVMVIREKQFRFLFRSLSIFETKWKQSAYREVEVGNNESVSQFCNLDARLIQYITTNKTQGKISCRVTSRQVALSAS